MTILSHVKHIAKTRLIARPRLRAHGTLQSHPLHKNSYPMILQAIWLLMAMCTTVTASIIQVPSITHPTIQSAINDAINADEIIVAAGTYPETINFLGKLITLRSVDGKDVTIIDATGLSDSAVKCVTGEGANTILDGFTITGGTGDVTVALSGGGMLNIGSSPTVSNCTFFDNSASTFGGGVFNRNANPTFTNCEFLHNSAPRGGGMGNDTGSQPLITRSLFQGNSSSDGAGLYNFEASPTIDRCIFFDNFGNFGGAICNETNSSPTITNCLFDQNIAADSGGAIANIDNATPSIHTCIFSENRASEGGALLNDINTNPTLRSCLFVGNTAQRFGGAVINISNALPQFTHCTFVNNFASLGSVLDEDSSLSTITNSIFWDNASNAFGGTNDPIVNFSIIQGGFTGGIGNIDLNPQFLDPDGLDDNPTTFSDNDYRLACDSPAIDSGDPTFMAMINELDLGQVPRVLGNSVDIGAHEFITHGLGDFNNDSQIDLVDIAQFSLCASENVPTKECICFFDFDNSNTITLDDFTTLHPLLTGP